MNFTNLFAIFCSVFVSACAPSRVVKPLPIGDYQVTVGAGGPLIDYKKNTIPMPLSSVAVAYGYRDNVTLYGGVQATAMVYGVIQTEFGALFRMQSPGPDRWGLTFAPAANWMTDIWENRARFYPSVDINLYHPIEDTPHFVYIGLANWFELQRKGTGGRTQSVHWVAAPHIGYTHAFKPWRLTGEMKWLAPSVYNDDLVVKYHGIGDHGALGVYVALGREF